MIEPWDRQLIELAAKAVSLDGFWDAGEFVLNGTRTRDNDKTWDPLHRDGDAFRLLVALQMMAQTLGKTTTVVYMMPNATFGSVTEPHAKDRAAATRRAIVLAAAEIGKAMFEATGPTPTDRVH